MKYKQSDGWKHLTDINDNDKIYCGIIARIYGVGLNVKNKEDDFYDYIISEVYNEKKLFQLVCLSQGEEGNITCVIKICEDEHEVYALGSELKRMLTYDKHDVYLNFNPKIKIE